MLIGFSSMPQYRRFFRKLTLWSSQSQNAFSEVNDVITAPSKFGIAEMINNQKKPALTRVQRPMPARFFVVILTLDLLTPK